MGAQAATGLRLTDPFGLVETPPEAGPPTADRPVLSLAPRPEAAQAPVERSLPFGRSPSVLRARLRTRLEVTVLPVAIFLSVHSTLAGARLLIVAFVPATILAISRAAKLMPGDEHRLRLSIVDDLRGLPQLGGVVVASAVAVQLLAGGPGLANRQLFVLFAASCVALLVARCLSRWAARLLTPPERCLLIGDTAVAPWIRERLLDRQAGLQLVGAVRLSDLDIGDPAAVQSLRELVDEAGASRVILAPVPHIDNTQLLSTLKALGVQISMLPAWLEIVGPVAGFDELDGLRLVGVPRFGLSRSSRLLKRGFDLALTGVGLIFCAPLIVLIAAAIKLDSRGPVFFHQIRVGRDGRRFRIIKFRSMVVDAEARKDELRSLSEVGQGMFKIAEDPRVTHVGRFLRCSSLDELPQILNVLRGDMSLVGPRPLIVEEDDLIGGLHRGRQHVPPGMTGPWQVLRRRGTRDEMLRLDYRYVGEWSLGLDVQILFGTLRHVLRRGNH